jgi:endonuclease/exonuclease/phosphatase family metal-dependent hydrolase
VNLSPWFSRLALWIRLREAKEGKEIHCSLVHLEIRVERRRREKRGFSEGGTPS